MMDLDLVLGDAVLDSHGVVGQGREGRDEGREDVEHAFLLDCVSIEVCWGSVKYCTYHRDTECHGVESNGGEQHEHEDDPSAVSQVQQSSVVRARSP